MKAASVWSAIAATASREPGATAMLWAGDTISYGVLAARARKIAASLHALGVRPGDRVAVALHNSPELVEALLGTLCLGATYVPLNPAYTTAEASYILDNVGARLFLAHSALRQSVADAVPSLAPRSFEVLPQTTATDADGAAADPESAALIVYTSGTTGRPKGAVLSHRALLSNLLAIITAWEWKTDDRLLLTLPCSHLHGLALGLLASLLAGSSVALRPRFIAEEVLGDIEDSACSMFFGVPTMYTRLLQLPAEEIRHRDLSRMRLWACGSAPLLPTTFERFRQMFGATLLERFGMSEGGFMIAASLRGPRRAGVVGLPVPGVELRIVDEEDVDRGIQREVETGIAGELLVRGRNLFSGYWGDPEASRAAFVDGWFRTGDLAVRDADGQIRIAGRRSADIIKTRGYKVSAVEIEDRLQSCSGVREVAVIGVPHADWGQEIVAVIVADPDCPPSAEGLAEEARRELASYKVPSRIVFVDEIPKVGPGKVRKGELVRLLTPP